MAREKRQISPTGIYHILLRGIDELFGNKADYSEFIRILEAYFEDSEAKLLGYALLKNRVHLIIDEASVGISAIMKPMCTRYARYYNRVYDLQGKLFYDRYKSEPITSDAELSGARAFLKSIPSEFSGNLEGVKKAESLAYIDDFYRMTDDELKAYIESIFACSIDKLDKAEKEVIAGKIIEGGRISAGRIYSIFDLRKKMLAKPAAPKPKKEAEQPKESEKKQEKLSFWLL